MTKSKIKSKTTTPMEMMSMPSGTNTPPQAGTGVGISKWSGSPVRGLAEGDGAAG